MHLAVASHPRRHSRSFPSLKAPKQRPAERNGTAGAAALSPWPPAAGPTASLPTQNISSSGRDVKGCGAVVIELTVGRYDADGTRKTKLWPVAARPVAALSFSLICSRQLATARCQLVCKCRVPRHGRQQRHWQGVAVAVASGAVRMSLG